jgi:hypothetical protein
MKTIKLQEKDIVGKALTEIEKQWDNIHCASVDGVTFMKTTQLSPNRMNVRVEKGIITEFLGYN